MRCSCRRASPANEQWLSTAPVSWSIVAAAGKSKFSSFIRADRSGRTKTTAAWSIPKGEFADEEDPLQAAQREFREETGLNIEGPFAELAPVKQRGGKIVHAWLVEADFDAATVRSNTFTIEWPRGSGKQREFPEVDRGNGLTLLPPARK